MARFLIATWPFSGHLFPQISVATALRARGHQVAFYTGGRVRPLLGEEGFTAFPFRRVDEDAVYDLIDTIERRPVGWRAPGLFSSVLRRWLVETIPDQVADLLLAIATWKPDVIISDPSMWAPALVLRETTGLPVAISSFLIGSLIPGPDAPPWGMGLPAPRTARTRLLSATVERATALLGSGLRRRVNEIRAIYDLPPLDRPVAALTADLPLSLVPSIPELDYNRRDLPPSVHYVGPCVWNKRRTETLPAWLETLPTDKPIVHVTEGTIHRRDPFVLRAAAKGLAQMPVHAILTTGPQRRAEDVDLGPLAPNIQVEQWVSHADLLPFCSVLVTTGGAGTVMAALQAGVPLLIVPTHWDKPDNAQRVVAAGAGLRLAPERCTARRLRDAVRQLLWDPRFRTKAHRLSRELAARPGPDGAAALLEGLVPPLARSATPALASA
ncbi:MAG TPA: glycosyltransferase [Chloroflexota bacterium]|nr:glycosyltransferase [Chloroflexota bacterium]